MATNRGTLLPLLMDGNVHKPALTLAVTITWVLGLVALGVVWCQRRHTVLDLWLMVVMLVFMTEVLISSFPVSARFSLGWYAGRTCSLVSGSLMRKIQNSLVGPWLP